VGVLVFLLGNGEFVTRGLGSEKGKGKRGGSGVDFWFLFVC
jgi:hypothetical protein